MHIVGLVGADVLVRPPWSAARKGRAEEDLRPYPTVAVRALCRHSHTIPVEHALGCSMRRLRWIHP